MMFLQFLPSLIYDFRYSYINRNTFMIQYTMVAGDVSIQMETNLINTPTRTRKGLAVVPWEFRLFKSLTSDNRIDVNDLIRTYETIMISHGLDPMTPDSILKLFENDKIGYGPYHETLEWFTDIYKHYSTDLSTPIVLNKKNINWNKNGVIIATLCLDLIGIGSMIWSKLYLPKWLLLAKVSALVILMNIAYLLIPLVRISSSIPDHVLAIGFPVEYSGVYHRVFGVKILIASLLHIVGHIVQIKTAISLCKTGCSRTSIYIVPKSDNQIVISYGYFAGQYPYITGIILTLVFASLAGTLVLSKKRLIRYSINQLFHQILSFTGIALIIAHGGKQLLGLNYSYILTLPLFILYCWRRRHKVFPIRVRINRWIVSPKMVRLYLSDKNLNMMLHRFGNATVYTNCPTISRLEWHPFTLTRGNGPVDAVLTMERVGIWTNSLATVLSNQMGVITHINFGHFDQSKFRFYHLYDTCYFFCAGMGITAFMATMVDKMKNYKHRAITMTLLWSVSDVGTILEFGGTIQDMLANIPMLKVKIYYSNRRKSRPAAISENMKLQFSYLQAIIYGMHKIDIVTGLVGPICCSLQRVDIFDILALDVARRYNRSTHNIGVFICGSQIYTEMAIKCVDLINRNNQGVKFRAWSESS